MIVVASNVLLIDFFNILLPAQHCIAGCADQGAGPALATPKQEEVWATRAALMNAIAAERSDFVRQARLLPPDVTKTLLNGGRAGAE